MSEQALQLTTIRLPIADREILRRWSQHNMTSMGAEILRSVRERAEREAKHVAGQ